MLKHCPFQVLQNLAFPRLAELLSTRIKVGKQDIQGLLRLVKRGWGFFGDLHEGTPIADTICHGGRVLDRCHEVHVALGCVLQCGINEQIARWGNIIGRIKVVRGDAEMRDGESRQGGGTGRLAWGSCLEPYAPTDVMSMLEIFYPS